MPRINDRKNGQRGVAAVEMAFVSTLLLMALLGTLEVGRVMFHFNTAAEGTRNAARTAAVCDLGDAQIVQRVLANQPHLAASDVSVTYFPAGCAVETCQLVTVAIVSTTPIPTFIPFVPDVWLMPSFTTTLLRESMQSALPGPNGGANPVCI
jgi:hypothetical protein